jgi:hypothetical protein
MNSTEQAEWKEKYQDLIESAKFIFEQNKVPRPWYIQVSIYKKPYKIWID